MAIELTQEINRRITTITEVIWKTTFLFQSLSIIVHGSAKGETPFSHDGHRMKWRCSQLYLLSFSITRLTAKYYLTVPVLHFWP